MWCCFTKCLVNNREDPFSSNLLFVVYLNGPVYDYRKHSGDVFSFTLDHTAFLLEIFVYGHPKCNCSLAYQWDLSLEFFTPSYLCNFFDFFNVFFVIQL